MDIARPVGAVVTSVNFGFLSPADIEKLSVKRIQNPEVFDNLGHPVAGGLYDLTLGAFSNNLCATCGLDDRKCMGHIGHIDLPIPVYNPAFFSHMYLYIRSSCLYCHRFKLKAEKCNFYACKLRLLQFGLLEEMEALDDLDNQHNESQDNDHNNDQKSLSERQTRFVEKSIAEAISSGKVSENGFRSPVLMDQRKNIIRDLYKLMLSRRRCENCSMYSPSYRKDGYTKLFETALSDKQANANRARGIERKNMVWAQGSGDTNDTNQTNGAQPIPSFQATSNGNRFVLSTEVANILRKVFSNQQPLCKLIFSQAPTTNYISADMFFVQKVVVPPTRFRLPSELGDEVHTNPTTDLLARILTSCLRTKDISDELYQMQLAKEVAGTKRKILVTQLMNQFVALQADFNAVVDATKSQSQSRNVPLPGIKQILERKEGLFRMNMMGKRVNYAARSVISPDPNLETNEIGIPPVFATNLTYPEPVTAHNFEELRQAVINGPSEWPGATQIQNENGSLVSLATLTKEQRTALANQLRVPPTNTKFQHINKKVYRHIRNQDVVLMNRQPTLHKASMMGHKVKVLPNQKTLRLHYANTGAYNADFDGDEMNMHFPQNEAARSEAFFIANTNSQYLTPTSGKPLRGLIQDHISAGVWLTNNDTFFTREKYHQLIYGSVYPETGQFASNKVLLLPPTIIKPEPLWTGKQIISTILLNVKPHSRNGLNLSSKNKVKNEYWAPHSQENTVLFKDGELLIGILDKSQYGAADYGLIHAIHEIYGADIAGLLLSVLGRLFTKYIMDTAFTCGIDDLRLTSEGDAWRSDILKQTKTVGLEAAKEVTNLPNVQSDADPDLRERLEEILRDDAKLGILDAITQSKVNAITSQVVQACLPEGTEKRFPYNSMQSMALSGAKGSSVNVSQIMCALSQQALEGRRVPVMVSGKTLPSFKAFETHVRAGGYISGRFYSGIKPQEYYFHCMAGREGLIDTAVKTSRSGYLQRCLIKQLEGVKTEYDNTVRDADGTLVQFMYGGDSIDVVKESYLKQFQFCLDNYQTLLQKHTPSMIGEIDDTKAVAYAKKVRKHLKKNPNSTKYDPVLTEYNPGRYMGSVSEQFEQDLDKFLEESKKAGALPNKLDKKFKSLMQVKYQQALVDPGECVGIVASQSIGEPSTQMTLNTFHFAGNAAMNVTLGIPRMREIIMTASAKIKTPQMVLPILPNVSDEHADAFCRSVTRIMLSQLIDKVIVTERTGPNEDGQYVRLYTVRINLYSRDEYEAEYDVTQRNVEQVLTTSFLSSLELAINKELRRQRMRQTGVAVKSRAKPAAKKHVQGNTGDGQGSDEEPDSDSDDDADMDDAKEISRKENETDYLDDEAQEASESEIEESSESDDEDEMSVDEDEPEPVGVPDVKPLGLQRTKASEEREQAVRLLHNNVTSFDFDDEMGEYCEFQLEYPTEKQKLLIVNLIEGVCRNVVVREVPHIDRCVRPPSHKEGRVIVTEGVNFRAMWQEDLFIEANGILSNDVSAVLHTYGVEAARATIVREISNVFETYAIAVNLRHLDLIADMMTRQGTFLPFSRQGLDSSVSPFMKMSFESTCQFLTKAVMDQATDELDSPSARVVLGRPFNGGTGSFDLLMAAS